MGKQGVFITPPPEGPLRTKPSSTATHSAQSQRRIPKHSRAASFSGPPPSFSDLAAEDTYEGDTEDSLHSLTATSSRMPAKTCKTWVYRSPLDCLPPSSAGRSSESEAEGDYPCLPRCPRKTWSFGDLQAAVVKERNQEHPSRAWLNSGFLTLVQQGNDKVLPFDEFPTSEEDNERMDKGKQGDDSAGLWTKEEEVKERCGWMLACGDENASPQDLRYLQAAKYRRSSELLKRDKFLGISRIRSTCSLPALSPSYATNEEMERSRSLAEEEAELFPWTRESVEVPSGTVNEERRDFERVNTPDDFSTSRGIEQLSPEESEETHTDNWEPGNKDERVPQSDRSLRKVNALPTPKLGSNKNNLLKFAIVNSYKWKSGLEL